MSIYLSISTNTTPLTICTGSHTQVTGMYASAWYKFHRGANTQLSIPQVKWHQSAVAHSEHKMRKHAPHTNKQHV